MKPSLIVHGGAGDWDDNLDQPKTESILQALKIGWDVLQRGGSALDAVEKAVNWLEDDPLFDAGYGSHLNADGVVEMDAIIIDAPNRNFGAVAGVKRVQYPISLARKVLEETEQNFFVGSGADALAARFGMPIIPNAMLFSDVELAAFKSKQKTAEVGDTVGAVALESNGNLAVATSTGGTPFKPAGRVGDSPIFGAGGYAENEYGGSSATGEGEQSLRTLLTKYVVDQIAAGHDAQAAADAAMVYLDRVFDVPMMGVIVIDKQGRVGAAHRTPKMAYGWIDENGQPHARMTAHT